MEMETEAGLKKVGHREDRESEMDSNSSNAGINLLPPEMLQSIYEFLPFKDLLVCREVSQTWKRVATDPLRKRCAPVDFSRDDIPKRQRSRALQSFIQLITATNELGDLGEFPVTEFKLVLNSDFFWVEKDGSTLISQFLNAVSHFVRHIIFHFDEIKCRVPNNFLALPQDLTFRNLTKITLEVYEEQDKHRVFSFIRSVIEKCPNVKEFHPHLYNIRRSGAIRRCIVETGIEQKAGLVTSLCMTAPKTEIDFEYLNQFGFKLQYFSLNLCQHNGNTRIFKAVLESQSDTLTSLDLTLANGNSYYQYFRDLPCLPHLKTLSVYFLDHKVEQQFPTLFYKEQLPALKKIDLRYVQFEANYFMASHMAPSESLRELILPNESFDNAGGVIRQAARLFPNLKKLQVFHECVGPYMSDIYEELTGIEELCITTDGRVSVDNIITGLSERLLNKIEYDIQVQKNPSYRLSKALAILEQRMTKSLACLENLKILMIDRGYENSADVVKGEDFTELSGVVFKQMKGLQRIDFGTRKHGPIISTALKENLEAHGIKLFYQRPRYIRARTDFIVSLTESDDSNSDYLGSGPDESDSHSDSD